MTRCRRGVIRCIRRKAIGTVACRVGSASLLVGSRTNDGVRGTLFGQNGTKDAGVLGLAARTDSPSGYTAGPAVKDVSAADQGSAVSMAPLSRPSVLSGRHVSCGRTLVARTEVSMGRLADPIHSYGVPLTARRDRTSGLNFIPPERSDMQRPSGRDPGFLSHRSLNFPCRPDGTLAGRNAVACTGLLKWAVDPSGCRA